MFTVILKNSFHNTEVKVRGYWGSPQEAWDDIQYRVFGVSSPTRADKQRYQRVVKALCGMDDCTCGTVR